MHLSPLQAQTTHEQHMLVIQMTPQLINVSEPGSSRLVPHPITLAASKPAHRLDHLVMIRIVEKGLGIFMIPVLPHLTLSLFRGKYREVTDCLRIVSQSLSPETSSNFKLEIETDSLIDQ